LTARHLLIAIMVVGFLTGILLALGVRGEFLASLWNEWEHRNTIEVLAQWIRASGKWGVAVSLGLMVMHSFLLFPAELVTLANGIVYGVGYGALITWTGAMLGAQAAFWTAHALGQATVRRVVRADRLERVDRWIASNGTIALLAARLIPVIAFNLINYAAGLARVRWWTFTWTTAVGIVPFTLLIVVAGDQVKSLPLGLGAALLLGALLLWTLVKWWQTKHAGAQ